MNLIISGLVSALGVTVYVSVVAWVMQNAERWLGSMDNAIYGPIAFLLMFVVSAAVTGSRVLGRPAMLYFNGQRAEAVRLFAYTIGWLVIGVAVFLLLNLA